MHTPTILWRFDAGIYVIMTSGLVSWDHLDLDDVLGEYTDDNDDRIEADLDNCTRTLISDNGWSHNIIEINGDPVHLGPICASMFNRE